MQSSLRDRVRILLFFTPWVSVPLALLGIVLAVTYPLMLVVRLAWILDPVAVVGAVLLARWLRPRYKLAMVDSSQLGVLYWLQRRG